MRLPYSLGLLATAAWSGAALALACGGSATQGSKGGPSAGGGSSGAAGSRAGAAQVAENGVTLPAPPDDSCLRFKLTYAEKPCDGSCAPLPCDPATVPDSLTQLGTNWCVFGPGPNCWTGFDCQYGMDPDLLGCTTQLACVNDSACSGGHCIIHAGNPTGECASGQSRARCREPDDCASGFCVAVDAQAHRACAGGPEWAYCNRSSQCSGGLRCTTLPGSFLGICTSGGPGHPCFDTTGCLAGLFCAQTPPSKPEVPLLVGQCSAGELGQPCARAEDCASGFCPAIGDRVCSAGALNDRCVDGRDCESGYCGPSTSQGRHCVSGDVAAPCDDNTDCKSQHCVIFFDAATPGTEVAGSCSEGKPGDPCGSSDQCESGSCGPPAVPSSPGRGACN